MREIRHSLASARCEVRSAKWEFAHLTRPAAALTRESLGRLWLPDLTLTPYPNHHDTPGPKPHIHIHAPENPSVACAASQSTESSTPLTTIWSAADRRPLRMERRKVNMVGGGAWSRALGWKASRVEPGRAAHGSEPQQRVCGSERRTWPRPRILAGSVQRAPLTASSRALSPRGPCWLPLLLRPLRCPRSECTG